MEYGLDFGSFATVAFVGSVLSVYLLVMLNECWIASSLVFAASIVIFLAQASNALS